MKRLAVAVYFFCRIVLHATHEYSGRIVCAVLLNACKNGINFLLRYSGGNQVVKRQRLSIAKLVKNITGNQIGFCLVLVKGRQLMKISPWVFRTFSSLPFPVNVNVIFSIST